MIRLPHLTTIFVLVALSSSNIVKSPKSDGQNFELLILHNNDMHARFEQTSQLSGACSIEDRDAGKCYGGFPRVAHVVKKAREAAASGEGPPVLYLNAGDTYTGTAWFTLYKWKIAAEFLNALQPDAVSLGNHEFDENVDGLVPFIRNLKSPVLAANLILTNVPELQNEPNLYKSIILLLNGIKIGIIGYLTPDTKFLAQKNRVEYEEEVTAITREVIGLKKQNVNVLIALGHSGFIKDLEIAKEVDDIDIVIGGHSNTFLWNHNHTDEIPEYPQGLYPTIVKQKSGRNVLVVQAYAYTKYMGALNLVFDDAGEIVSHTGDPILLNYRVPEDPDVLEKIKRYRIDIDRINSEVVGMSNIFLDGEQCRFEECNLGNFINDAIVLYTRNHNLNHKNVTIGITQGGRIRNSINGHEKPFKMTRGDWINVIPFTDMLSIITMNGTVLKKALEHSVENWRKIDAPGQFLQFSGIKVVYDLAKKPGFRVVDAKAICSECSKLEDIIDTFKYNVITSTFIADGGDGFSIFESLPKEIVSYNEITCVLAYLKKNSPIEPKIDNRITLKNKDFVQNIPNIFKYVTDDQSFTNSQKTCNQINIWLVIAITSFFLLH